MSEFTYQGRSLRLVSCGTCGVEHAIPQARWRAAYRESGYWHCPNGHQWGYAESEADRLRRQRDSLQQQIARVDDEKRELERRAEAAERKAARVTKRAHAGVCQCCNRSFANVARHMKAKHPNVVPIKKGANNAA